MAIKKFIIFLLVFFILFLSWAMYNTGKDSSYIAQGLKSLLPDKTKVFLKKTLFAIRVNSQKADENFKRIKILETELDILKSQLAYHQRMLTATLPRMNDETIVSISDGNEGEKFNLTTYQLPFPNYAKQLAKPIAYIDQVDENIILVTGHGRFYKINKKELVSKNVAINLEAVETNIESVVDKYDYKEFYSPSWHSVKDILITDNKIFVSHSNLKRENCYNTEIIYSPLNDLKNFIFEKYFSYSECAKGLDGVDINVQHGGGRMIKLKNGDVAFTIGDYGIKNQAQNIKSMFGKIISIDKNDPKKFNIIAMGSRNAQGLVELKSQNSIIHSEHGPIGGDEINVSLLDNKIENFGWPKVSYGKMGDGSPVKSSHEKFGFKEPLKYYTPAIGISEIKYLKTINKNPLILVSSMGWADEEYQGDRSLQILEINPELTSVLKSQQIPINQRIRDFLVLSDSKNNNRSALIMILENAPSIGYLMLN